MRNPKSAKRLLTVIRQFLETAPAPEAKRAWDVLTALRGPDNDNHELKMATTARVRHAALGVAPRAGLVGAFSEPGVVNADLDIGRAGGYHFAVHIRDAVVALRAMGKDV